ncbi:SRPBCC family protein [Rhodococcus sp. NPDC003382]|uniref:SRPBCC family protein n=1 Tax=unclassified Rhodococcus (in: high G+C Gram-positive bacteria) TaxID=192944 RepID=UPI0018CF6D78|nr:MULTISPECIES: SRPBCC family protein [unclassified Rhodococcus (in: high G+C Gram-positive bacteria)]MBH0122960.1 SRPBCC family protein [Rhodococcus sp. CX]MCK8670931.1 SRPBCC family protein [Rhodococcus sp. HM1]
MAVTVSDRFDIDAAPEQVMRALEDVEHIPEWSSAHKNVEVLTRDPEGRPRRIRMTLSLFGFSDTQTIEHDWTERSTSWTLVDSTMQRSQDGMYALEPSEHGTRVQVTMSLDPKVPVPGFVLRRGQKHALDAIRRGLTDFVLARYT